ncbi:MAG TPA: hypothetical protein VFF68_11910 [Anaerolineaceae bacterium]|nr:hypothetical protein [Anaerolineaceae bacterium]
MRNLGTNKILWLLTAVLTFAVALLGALRPAIYAGVLPVHMLPGTLSQDLLSVAAAVVLFVLALRARAGSYKLHIVILGVLGYLFYAYGIYAIERVYNLLYYVYLATFGLSFYALIYGVASFQPEALRSAALPGGLRKLAAGFSLFIAVLFSILWIVMLLPMLQSGQKPEATYSIYILDLSFIMPAFVILAVMALRRQGLGLVLTPAMYVLGVTLLFPVGLGELFKPMYGFPVDPFGVGLYLGIAALFLVALGLYLPRLSFGKRAE